MSGVRIALSGRQRDLLGHVVEAHVATGQPVGSKTLVAQAALGVSPSTVRAELAELERLGLLTHPHTSAGRVATEAGYRGYVDGLPARKETRPPRVDRESVGEGKRGGLGGGPLLLKKKVGPSARAIE